MSDGTTSETAAGTARSTRPSVIGTVISDKMEKTIIVRRDVKVKHPLYKKFVRRSTKYVAHDDANQARSGDEVEIVQTRPLSKSKRWRLVRIVREAPRDRDVPTGPTSDLEPQEQDN